MRGTILSFAPSTMFRRRANSTNDSLDRSWYRPLPILTGGTLLQSGFHLADERVFTLLDLVLGVEQAAFLVIPLLLQLVDQLLGSDLALQIGGETLGFLRFPDLRLDILEFTLRVPRQVVVHDKRAELQVHALGGGFRGDHDRCPFGELLDQGRAHVGGRRTAHALLTRMAGQPRQSSLAFSGKTLSWTRSGGVGKPRGRSDTPVVRRRLRRRACIGI